MATRYWVGGGSSANWNATGNTNWSATSGGANNASVPTSTDDVIFDGAGTNGNTASTISATITVLSLTITTGYTNTMTHNAVLTIAGNWTYVNTYTIAGTSGITLSATSTIKSNGTTWPNSLTLSAATTYNLSGDFTVSGLVTASANSTINGAAFKMTIAGGVTTPSVYINGTAKIVLTGGTLSGGSSLSNNLDFNGNVTITGTIVYNTGTITYVSGTITTTGSTLSINTSVTLNTNGITWNNLSFITSAQTCTLTSNLSVNGLMTVSAATTLNGSTYTATVAGGITVNQSLSGNTKLILTGGTWSHSASGYEIGIDTDIQGNITVSGKVYFYNKTLTYVSGTVTTTGSTLRPYGNFTLNTNGITWNNYETYSTSTGGSISTNLLINGTFTVTAAATINTSNSSTITINNGIILNQSIGGTAKIILTGGTWSGGVYAITNNLDIQGNATISGSVYYNSNTLTYVSGTITTTGSTLQLTGTTTLNTTGLTWNNITFYGSNTTTLTSNLSVNGLMTVSAATTLNGSSYTATVAGGITMNAAISGTTKIILTGGTWSGGAAAVNNDLDLNGNITISGVVYYNSKTLTYVSGTITVTGSTLNIQGSCVLNINGIGLNNLTFANTNTTYITSNLLVNGLITVSGATIINKRTTDTITISGGISLTNSLGGNSKILFTSGTWTSSSATGVIGLNLDIQGNITLSGTVYYGGFGYGIIKYVSGSVTLTNSTLQTTNTCNIDLNGLTLNNFSTGTNNQYTTLLSNLSVGGLYTNSITTFFLAPSGQSFSVAGGITNTGAVVGGVKINLTGGTWSGSGPIISDLDLNGNITVSGTVTVSSGSIWAAPTVRYVSGTITTTGSTVSFNNHANFFACQVAWNNVTFGANFPNVTINSNLTINGILSTSGGNGYFYSYSIPYLSSDLRNPEIISVYGGINVANSYLNTAHIKIILYGGTWQGSGSLGAFLDLNGDITLSGNVGWSYFSIYNQTLKHVSGTINTAGSTLILRAGNAWIDTEGVAWNNISCDQAATTIALKSNLHILGSFTNTQSIAFSNYLSSDPKVVNVYNGLTVGGTIDGASELNLYGGTWSGTNTTGVSSPLSLRGNVTISGNVYYRTRTLSHVSGRVTSVNGILNITGTSTVLGFKRVQLSAVVITASSTITMDRFFCGRPNQICAVSSTGANYTIQFQDAFEKMAHYVSVSGATISRTNQLMVVNNSRFNTNRTTNSVGIRYSNHVPNAVGRRAPSLSDTMTAPALSLAPDPCFQRQG